MPCAPPEINQLTGIEYHDLEFNSNITGDERPRKRLRLGK